MRMSNNTVLSVFLEMQAIKTVVVKMTESWFKHEKSVNGFRQTVTVTEQSLYLWSDCQGWAAFHVFKIHIWNKIYYFVF